MSSRSHLRLAAFFLVFGVGIVAACAWALMPMWRRAGPSPGAGAQYMFFLVPTVGIAALALATGAVLVARVRQRDPAQRTGPTLAVVAVSAAAGGVLLVWTVCVAFVLFAPAT